MKKTLVIGVLLGLLAAPLGAQEVAPAVHAGSRSVNFSFGGLGSFGLEGAGVGGGLSASYFMSHDRALRMGVQLGYNRSTTPWNGGGLGSDGSQWSTVVDVAADYLKYMRTLTPRARPYAGMGVSVLSAWSDMQPALAASAPAGTLTEIKNGGSNDGVTVGANAILGAEFFLFPELSISAEYHLNVVSYTHRADKVTSRIGSATSTEKQGSSLHLLGFGAGGATVHIYF